MALAADDNKFAKVLIQGHEDTTVTESSPENFFIAGVFIQLARPQDIMTSGSYILADSASDTAIKQKPHAGGLTKNGSTRS